MSRFPEFFCALFTDFRALFRNFAVNLQTIHQLMTDGLKLFGRISGKIIALALIVEFIVRVILAAITPGALEMTAGQWVGAFVLGAVNDLCFVVPALLFLLLYCLSIGRGKYRRPWGWILLSLLVAAFIYVCCFNTVFNEYGSVVPLIARLLLGFWAGGFALRLFVPSVRRGWSRFWFWALVSVYVLVIYFNACSEYFFWDEFNVRYNFIAVDYLIYTNEVIGNIMESYAIVPLALCVLVAAAVTSWLLFRRDARRIEAFAAASWKLPAVIIWAVAAALCAWLMTFNTRFQQTGNTYYNELQANGPYKFFDAFRKNHLDYEQFYLTLPQQEAEAAVHRLYGSTGENLRHVAADSTVAVYPAGARPNIVLITMESMSADFMKRYGSTRDITPNLDSLALKSLVFDNLIATGNRTVRGLEALSLSLPPCPGESIIKRPDCGGMRSTASMLAPMGYRSIYFYGGNSYFDNMGTFFGGNGYEIVDATSYRPEEITFKNIWGVSDEDSYRKAIAVLDTVAPQGPFFAHIMSISNHRPYTYPEGRIPIPTNSKKRAGGVMYADWAIGEFFRLAQQQPWFDNTVFVIVADHCASSAGKTDLPLEKYHIPAMVYAPGHIEPQAVGKFCSQIDLMPTVFALLGMDYDSYFFGENILSPDFTERAFLATYEDLGYLQDGVLTVLSPVRRVEQFAVSPTPENPYNTVLLQTPDSTLVNRAIALYQTSATWYHPDKTGSEQ